MNSCGRFFVVHVLVCSWGALLLTGCNRTIGPSLRGSGVAKTETRATDSFAEIDVSSAIQLDFKVGPTRDLELIADDNLLPYIKTEVEGDRLTIYVNESYSSNLGVKVQATAPTLRALTGSGASKVTLGDITSERFQVTLSGASNCQMNIQADALKIDLSGASRAAIGGTAKELAVNCSGASRLDAIGLTAASIDADLSGASSANVKATDQLAAEVSGASTLRYAGNPAKLNKETSGASTISVVEIEKAEKE